MDLKLNGKRALITGASRGLGYATALGLGGEGARLAINSRSAEAIQSAADKIQLRYPTVSLACGFSSITPHIYIAEPSRSASKLSIARFVSLF